MKIETERLVIRMASQSEMTQMIEAQADAALKTAYREML